MKRAHMWLQLPQLTYTSGVIRQKVQAVFVERTSVTGICKRAETSLAHRHDNCLI